MAFNIDILRQNTLDERSAEYKALKKERIKGSYLTETQRREVHNAQRAMDRNIKSTKRAIAAETSTLRRENLKDRLSVLESLKESMAQSSSIGGNKVYHSAASRLDAMEMFNYYYRDTKRYKRLQEQAAEGITYEMKMTEGQKRMLTRFTNKYGNFDFTAPFENTPTYELLYDDFMKAIRAYDSDEAKRIASKMQKAYEDFYSQNTPRGDKVVRGWDKDI